MHDYYARKMNREIAEETRKAFIQVIELLEKLAQLLAERQKDDADWWKNGGYPPEWKG